VRLLAVALLAAVTLSPAAAAHPRAEGYARGFQSKVLSVRPEVAGLAVSVVDGDDRLRIENESGTDLVVLGYDGEPYLRIGAAGVFRNERSPAAYLNRDRFARVAVPLRADPAAKPVWRRVSPRPVWQWHDHRIQWMGAGPPVEVREQPRKTHAIFDWQVPTRFGGRAQTVSGRLDYVPPDEGGASPVVIALVAITGAAAVLGLGLLLVRLRRREGAAAHVG
jgi:MYXO-CTERM domain-containing protein